MRLAFVSDSVFPWFNGGIEKRRYVIMRKLVESGNEVHCFTMHRDGMPGKDFMYNGIKYHCVGEAADWQGMYSGGGKRRSTKMPLRFAIRLFTKIFPYRFDALDADSFPFLHIIPLYFYSLVRGIKFSVTWHEVWSRSFWEHYLSWFGNVGYAVEWLCARSADVHIANASSTKDLLVKELGVDPGKVIVFPAAVDSEEIADFKKRHSCAKKNKFVVVSRLVKHKRVQLAIEAIAKTNAKLDVVGTGPEQEGLKKLASERARGKVRFIHGLETEGVLREMCESRALIMPSEREGLSLVTLEALAVGTPVVIADTSSLPKELRKMCLEAREEKMGELLNRLSKDHGRYGGDAERNSRTVLLEFSGDRANQVYERIVRGRM